jgi:hypothetical protein
MNRKEDYLTSTVDGSVGFQKMYGEQYEGDTPSLSDFYEEQEEEQCEDDEWFDELLKRRFRHKSKTTEVVLP